MNGTAGVWLGLFLKGGLNVFKPWLADEGKVWVLDRLKLSNLSLFQLFHSFKAAYIKTLFSSTQRIEPSV